MTISFLHGDIFDSGCDALVCPVNTVGVMGAGLACQFKMQYPEMYKYYYQDCKKGNLSLGRVKIYTSYAPATIVMATKQHYKDPDNLECIYQGLRDLVANLRDPRHRWERVGSVALPALGGLQNWQQVRSMTEQLLAGLSQRILVYEPMQKVVPESNNWFTCQGVQ